MIKIMIVDDEPKIRELYKRLLNDEGYEVLLASDATEATRILVRRDDIDLILLDINMPEIDGAYMREVIEEYNPDLRVIVSSVRPLDEQKEMIPQAVDYFDKSKGIRLLMNKINRVLQHA